MNTTTQTTDTTVAGIMSGIIYVAIIIVIIVAYWKLFQKAGYAGWKALIPFYNLYILCKIAQRPGWWLILLCIPIVNWVVLAIVSVDIAKGFGKSTVFALVAMWFFSPIGQIILGFGPATYDASRISPSQA